MYGGGGSEDFEQPPHDSQRRRLLRNADKAARIRYLVNLVPA